MISFDEAVALVSSLAQPLEIEAVPIEHAHGRVLARSVIAAIDSPRRAVSAMDGFAVRDEDVSLLPTRLRVTGKSFAGQSELPKVRKGECARVFTGGALPSGTDRVVIQELVRCDGDWAEFGETPGPSRHVRARASDFSAGDVLVPQGTELGPRALVAVAAADTSVVEVYRSPLFSVLGTGDELARPGCARDHPAQIPESLSIGISALGEQWGGSCIARIREADDFQRLEHVASEALDTADVLIVTGGASVGERDYAKAMFGEGLEIAFSKVAIKPGKPVWLGRCRDRLVLGLPGNPTSAMVTARLFLAPLMAGLSGQLPLSALRWRHQRLATAIPATGDRETFLRACWSNETVEVLSDQDSGAQRVLVAADLLVRRRARAEAASAGSEVEVLEF